MRPAEPDPLRPGPPDPFDRWLAEVSADRVIGERARTGWLARQAAEDATWRGALADLAERGRPVLVELRSGRRHRGTVAVIGHDFLVLRPADGSDVLVALDAIAVLWPSPGDGPVTGDREPPSLTTIGEALAGLAAGGQEVAVWTAGASVAVVGEIAAVGRDLVTLAVAGERGWAYLALASVAEVSLVDSG
ncbi:hypothetical protein [Rhabdothermincola sediminis]|uniref:hypothetical protein n=1 Tax=Rhabdothermincola sediminis TaxID=2751370 RepID=UPI001AA0328A|nr:hypothetical protein [Rhabdothermincola sediminis]